MSRQVPRIVLPCFLCDRPCLRLAWTEAGLSDDREEIEEAVDDDDRDEADLVDSV